jgi:hypothetical protein
MVVRTLPETPDLQWFDPYPPCRMCGKKADGVLMSVRNERWGEHCRRCADKRLKLSAQVREMLFKERNA